ncbi:MAG: hypothetical protein GX117_10090 [Candidatus Hydrogenedentes bacterium]|nr:hypothetical protein [Candidatus Hydrogenedentota bacterium]
MNPFLKQYISRISASVENLEVLLERHERLLHAAQDEKEQKVQEWWSIGRNLKTMEHTLARLPSLEDENQRLREQNLEIRERTKRILTIAKAISGSIEL